MRFWGPATLVGAIATGCSLFTSLNELVPTPSDLLDGSSDTSSSDAASSPDTYLPPPMPPCDPNEVPAANGVFVSTLGNDTGLATRADPLKTITAGVARAKTNGVLDLYVDEGTYAEAVTTGSPLKLYAAWKANAADWKRDCADSATARTVLRSPSAQGIVVGVAGATSIESLTIVTKATGAPGESVVGVVATVSNTQLHLSGVDVTAGAGGDGAATTATAPPGLVACGGYGDCKGGAAGTSGSSGSAGPAGHFTASGYVPGDGGAGLPGGAAENGTKGGDGAMGSNCVQSCGSPPGCLSGPTGASSGSPGSCGCGGKAGPGGQAGKGGGASVGVLVSGTSTVTITFSNVRASAGGAGSTGGMSPGSSGGSGAGGANGFCASSCWNNSGTCYFTGGNLSGGAAGGAGGMGGAGGQGGGGSGGPSYGVVTVGGAIATLDATALIAVAVGGSGAGGSPAGASGNTLVVP